MKRLDHAVFGSFWMNYTEYHITIIFLTSLLRVNRPKLIENFMDKAYVITITTN
jgi:hypothetical protein